VAFERMGRLIRQAKAVTAITQPTDPQGSISILDFSDQTHVFQLTNGTLYYGTADPADQLLAEGFQELRLEGYDANGPVPPSSPGDIDAVRVEATAAVPGTGETVSLATFVRLRRQVVEAQVRDVICHATQYQTTLGAGLEKASRGLYEPDSRVARLRARRGGRYHGFSQSKYNGPIHFILAGIRMRYRNGSLQVVIRRGWWAIYSHTFSPSELAHVKGRAVWWWIDLTALHDGWDEGDIPDLSIEVRDPGTGDADAQFDSFAIRAFFDPPPTLFLWADREGNGTEWPNQWSSPEEAFGRPDEAFATGAWASEQSQAYRTPRATGEDESVAVHACIKGYISISGGSWGLLQSLDEALKVRIAKPNEKADAGIEHSRTIADMLDRVGFSRRGHILFDVTNDRKWNLQSLDDYEIRIKLDPDGSTAASLRADAVGWRIIHLGTSQRGVSQWSER